MNLQYFPHFIRKNYPEIAKDITNEECLEIGTLFKKHLEDVFKDNKDKLTDIWNIDMMNVVANQGHPLKMNGYHPALILHFNQYVKEQAEEMQKELNK